MFTNKINSGKMQIYKTDNGNTTNPLSTTQKIKNFFNYSNTISTANIGATNSISEAKDNEVFNRVEPLINEFKAFIEKEPHYYKCSIKFRSMLSQITTTVSNSASPELKDRISTEMIGLIKLVANKCSNNNYSVSDYDALPVVMWGELAKAKYTATGHHEFQSIIHIDYIMGECNKDFHLTSLAHRIRNQYSDRGLDDLGQRHGTSYWGMSGILKNLGKPAALEYSTTVQTESVKNKTLDINDWITANSEDKHKIFSTVLDNYIKTPHGNLHNKKEDKDNLLQFIRGKSFTSNAASEITSIDSFFKDVSRYLHPDKLTRYPQINSTLTTEFYKYIVDLNQNKH